MAAMDIQQRDDLAFPQSLPEFQQLFPDDAACAAYLGRARWPGGFVCPHCGLIAEPFRIVTRPGVLECRACRRQAGLLVGTVMERSHTPISVWFWAAYLVASLLQIALLVRAGLSEPEAWRVQASFPLPSGLACREKERCPASSSGR